ncbi:hypothetical protein [Nocardia arthritidis]|uniref:Uncharacterized protein n=1 Tax=Nocardia arthritidis TaxID=228602 RepID=A0A6G9YG81_9NOCA|nr:hypothetical protein [Nocardia arthritidis]QIS12184.1 hypothetical protein F5544_21605 [Nocardia arthritidis]
MTEEWRGVVNAILYVVQFNELGPAEVSRVSRDLLTKPFFDLTADQEYRALLEALESGAELNATIGTRHSEAEIRDFLNRIVAELDDMRPWPEVSWPEIEPTSTVPRGSIARYRTTPIHPEFVGEEVPGNRVWRDTHVKYLNATERQAYKLTIRDGLLYDSTGRLLDTSTASTLWTPQGGRAIFVMDENGDLYSSPQHIAGVFHHSSFLAGAPVAGAGEIRVSNGHLALISDHSTHYRPARKFTHQVVEHLREKGVHIDDSQVEYHAHRKRSEPVPWAIE